MQSEARRKKRERTSNSNKIRQVIPAGINKDGRPTPEKIVFHQPVRYLNHPALWKDWDSQPRFSVVEGKVVSSKSQQRKRADRQRLVDFNESLNQKLSA
jgi:hypothetical protein